MKNFIHCQITTTINLWCWVFSACSNPQSLDYESSVLPKETFCEHFMAALKLKRMDQLN